VDPGLEYYGENMDFGSLNFGDLMARAQALQTQVGAMKEKMQNSTFEGADEDGAVRITMSGKYAPVSVKCDTELFGEEEAEILEKLIFAALINVTNQIRSAEEQSKQDLGQSLGLPPGLMGNLPGF